jgi:tight adherence protein B
MFSQLSNVLGAPGLLALMGVLTFFTVYSVLYILTAPNPTISGASRLKLGDKGTSGRKMKGVDRRKQIQEQLRKQEEMRKQSSKVPLSVMMERGGIEGSVASLYLKFALVGMLITGGLVMVGIKPLFAVAALPVVTVLFTPKYVNWRINRLQKKFIAEFPNAIDILVRGVRTGLPVNEGMRVIAREVPEPVCTEFRIITESTAVGVTLEDALQRFYNRMPLSEVNFFNIVLAIQKQTGGNLAEALGNLSTTLRERKKLKNKIKALSSEAKASASIIGSLPFLLGIVLYIVAPQYISLLFTETLGNYMIGAGLFWMGCGIFMMKTMMDFEI